MLKTNFNCNTLKKSRNNSARVEVQHFRIQSYWSNSKPFSTTLLDCCIYQDILILFRTQHPPVYQENKILIISLVWSVTRDSLRFFSGLIHTCRLSCIYGGLSQSGHPYLKSVKIKISKFF